jgi:hypothetical protein
MRYDLIFTSIMKKWLSCLSNSTNLFLFFFFFVEGNSANFLVGDKCNMKIGLGYLREIDKQTHWTWDQGCMQSCTHKICGGSIKIIQSMFQAKILLYLLILKLISKSRLSNHNRVSPEHPTTRRQAIQFLGLTIN